VTTDREGGRAERGNRGKRMEGDRQGVETEKEGEERLEGGTQGGGQTGRGGGGGGHHRPRELEGGGCGRRSLLTVV
jgi:hypothetical protein